MKKNSISFSKVEKDFLESMEECRFATSHHEICHVKPVSFIFKNNQFFIATDYDTRSFKNLLINPKTALTIDIYKENQHRAVCIQGKATILEEGKDFQTIYEDFFKKFEWVRNDPWEEKEAPFIMINPFNKTSWGIN